MQKKMGLPFRNRRKNYMCNASLGWEMQFGPDDVYPARWLCMISLTDRYKKGLYVSIGSGSL